MPFSLLPKIMTNALTDIPPELLRSRKIRLLMLDFDNTIVPYTTTVPTPEMERWLKDMNALEDISLCIVSNSHNDLGMIRASKAGFLFKSTDQIKADNPDLEAFETYDELMAAIKKVL